MRILISGATGLIGSALTRQFVAAGHNVVPLTRTPRPGDDSPVGWDPQRGELFTGNLDGFDVVVHLAGESIASGLWTRSRKQRIRDSRVVGTQHLCRLLTSVECKPSVLLAASAIGYYGSRGDNILTEESPPGQGFMADLCRDWERATTACAQAGMRVACLRIGPVLSGSGGLLARATPPFRLGLGGRIGSGSQYMSWITLEDLVAAVDFILNDPSASGAYNMTTPHPVTNAQFTRTLAKALHRPALMPVPAFALKLLPGNMAEEMFLMSSRVLPQRLLDAGFRFRFPKLDDALIHELS